MKRFFNLKLIILGNKEKFESKRDEEIYYFSFVLREVIIVN